MARSTFFYTDSRILGGAEEAMFTLIEMLDRSAWHPELVLNERAAPAMLDRAAELDVPVHLVTPMPLGAKGGLQAARFAKWLARRRPDVFHAHLSSPLAAKWPLAAAALVRVPAIAATLQLVPPYRITTSSLLQLRGVAHGVGRYFAVSRDIAEYLVKTLHVPERKVQVLHNAIRHERYAHARPAQLPLPLPPGTDRAAGVPGGVVLTCARMDTQKGHEILLRAAQRMPDTIFLLAGEGREQPRLEELARELGIAERVLFLGHRNDVPELLASCDVFALPSLYEGTSLALLEAMAAGCAIVATAIPGTVELLTGGQSGLLVTPGDPVALAEALERVIGDEQLRERLAAGAQARGRDFSPDTVLAEVTGAYRELLGDDRGGRVGRPDAS